MRTRLACVNGVDLLMDYVEDVLPGPQRKAVDAHLGGCPRCVAFVRSYLETPRIVRTATAVAMPAGVRESLRRFLASRRG